MDEAVGRGAGRRRPGIVDVAALAGVAPSTVSRSLSEHGTVAASTRKRVLEAARQLSYVPSPYASGLATGRTRTVAVVVPFGTRWFFGSVLSGVTRTLEHAGYDVLLYCLGSAAERDRFFERMPLAGRVDGVLSVSMPLSEEHTLALRALDIAIVTVGSHMSGLPCVRIDEIAAAEQAVNHLLHLGHRQIAFLGGIADDPDFGFVSSADRLAGYRRALTTAGLQHDRSLASFGRYGIDGGAAAMTRLMSQALRPTAVFAEYDELAIGALWSLRRAGLSVPQDVSVVGIDDHEMAKVLDLTTVGQDAAGQGALGAELLVSNLDGSADSTATKFPADIVRPTDLILRGSTAPPGRSSDPARPRR